MKTNFNHDYVFVFDGGDRPIYAQLGRVGAAQPSWTEAAMPELVPVLDYMRGRDLALDGALPLTPTGPTETGAHPQIAVIRDVAGRPAVIAAAAVAPAGATTASLEAAPIVMSVKFIDNEALAGIAAQLHLAHLRQLGDETPPSTDLTYNLDDPQGKPIARFAWTPKQPGAEIVSSVIPFIAVALAGFALLAAFVLRYMRRTAVAIAAGETRLRHLAMHDPLCGLPNRIFFGERLEAVIEEVRAGSSPAAVFYIDLDHFKDVNDTLGHPVGDELIRNVTLRLSHTLRGDDLVARLGGDEFAVISSIGDDSVKMMAVAQRIIAAICAPYTISGQNIIIGASIGIAVIDNNCARCRRHHALRRHGALPRQERRPQPRLHLRRGDGRRPVQAASCWKATCARRSRTTACACCTSRSSTKAASSVVGVEALCRWTHPTRGEIPPSEFIADRRA